VTEIPQVPPEFASNDAYLCKAALDGGGDRKIYLESHQVEAESPMIREDYVGDAGLAPSPTDLYYRGEPAAVSELPVWSDQSR
jgi:hypothetical protein